jgi:hypothetical protein
MYWLSGKPDTSQCTTEEELAEACNKAVEAGATFGFPVTGIKKAAVSAAFRNGVTKDKVTPNGIFHIIPIHDFLDQPHDVGVNADGMWRSSEEMIQIHGKPRFRQDMVKIGMGVADIRFRGEFLNWWTEFDIRYNANMITPEQIAAMFTLGGFSVGIGEWRIEKGGVFGAYKVV